MGMPGHMGDERVTVQNLQVMQVRETEKMILISGAVPGLRTAATWSCRSSNQESQWRTKK